MSTYSTFNPTFAAAGFDNLLPMLVDPLKSAISTGSTPLFVVKASLLLKKNQLFAYEVLILRF